MEASAGSAQSKGAGTCGLLASQPCVCSQAASQKATTPPAPHLNTTLAHPQTTPPSAFMESLRSQHARCSVLLVVNPWKAGDR